MTVYYTSDQKEYIRRVCYEPKTVDEVLTMNYCIAWCKEYGKTFEDWRDAGFNNHMYSPVRPKHKQKLLRLNVEKMEAK